MEQPYRDPIKEGDEFPPEYGPSGARMARNAAEQRRQYRAIIREHLGRMLTLYVEAAGDPDQERSKAKRSEAHREFTKAKEIAHRIARTKGEQDEVRGAAPVVVEPVLTAEQRIEAMRDKLDALMAEDCLRAAREEAERMENEIRKIATKGSVKAMEAFTAQALREQREQETPSSST